MMTLRRAIHGFAATSAVALIAAGLPGAAAAQSLEEKATSARQGLMQLIVWEAGPLFAMAKGDVAYDAQMASTRAQNLAVLAQYAGHSLFLPGTSAEDMPGTSAALPSAWTDQAGFHQGFEDLKSQTAVVVAEAGKGQEQLRAAVGELGKVCGDCHESFRQKN